MFNSSVFWKNIESIRYKINFYLKNHNISFTNNLKFFNFYQRTRNVDNFSLINGIKTKKNNFITALKSFAD